MPSTSRALRAEWQTLLEHLHGLQNAIERGSAEGALELNDLARRFGDVAKAYHAAILSAGKSSIRIRAMLKALDLRTPKSELMQFLGEAQL